MKKLICLFLLAGAAFTLVKGQPATGDSPAHTIHLTKTEFLVKVADYVSTQEWKYLGDKPAIIDFYADWCGPCKMVAPVLEELAAEYEGHIYIYKINTDAETELAALFNIRSIPYLLFIPMGETPQALRGAAPKSYLKEVIDEVLLKP
ncbi:MAG: thioredoxin [Tannerellaceae bacterium]|jgi:thioredoxin|nr:thioredoxin [Tannerellaceae bacterium]